MAYSRDLPAKCLLLVFYHVESQLQSGAKYPPLAFMVLSAVSKQFYNVFTSDDCWRQYDVYSIENDIYHHFIEAMARSPTEARAIMSGFDSSHNKKEISERPYDAQHELNLYIQAQLSRLNLIKDDSLTECADVQAHSSSGFESELVSHDSGEYWGDSDWDQSESSGIDWIQMSRVP